MEIPRDLGKYEIVRPIGNGSFSGVYLATEKATGEQVAIKAVNELVLIKNRMLERFNYELEIMKKISHPNIVKVHEVITINHWIFIVQEYGANGTLYNYIIQSKILTERETLRITHDLLEALAYLHSIGIAHRDIKPENIVFDKFMAPKLIDFGFATDTTLDNKLHHTQCGSVAYVAPEVMTPFGYDPKKSDIWSLGVTAYVMSTGMFPWNLSSNQSILKQIYNWNCELPETIPVPIRGLLQKMLVKESYNRATAAELLNEKSKWTKIAGSSMGDIELQMIGDKILLKNQKSMSPSPLVRRRTIIRPSPKKHKSIKPILGSDPSLLC